MRPYARDTGLTPVKSPGFGDPRDTIPAVALHGRDHERRALADALATARDGRSRALVVHGAAGAGKTSLLAAAEADALEIGMRVLRATGSESERVLPFALLHALLRPLLGGLDALSAAQADALRAAFGLGTQDAAPDRFLVSLAALTLLADAAAAAPVLVLADDVQWADEPSVQALWFVARRLDADPIALVLAARDEVGAPFDPMGLPDLEIGPLDGPAALAILRERAGEDAAPAVADDLVTRTGGLPLALDELARALAPDVLAGRAALPDPLPFGDGIERAYTSRVRALGDPARTALLVAALDGTGAPDVVLAGLRALGLGDEALQPAERAGLVRLTGDGIAFAHPLVRSATVHAATFAERRTAHRALADGAPDDDRRAWHEAAAAVGPDPAVAAALCAAAERARSRGARATAAAGLERAAELTSDPLQRAVLLAQGAEDAWRGGRPALARALIARASALDPPPALDGTLQRLLGTIEAWTGTPARACEVLGAQAAAAAPDDAALALRLLAEAAEAASFSGDAALATTIGELATAIEPPAGDARAALLAELLVGMRRYVTGDPGGAAPHLRRVVEDGRRMGDLEALTLAGRAAVYLADDDMLVELGERSLPLARAAGDMTHLPQNLTRLTLAWLRRARIAAAERDGAEALRLAEAAGQDEMVACAHAMLAYAAALRGDEAETGARAAAALARCEPLGLAVFADLARTAEGHVALAQGRPAEAWRVLAAPAHPAVALTTIIDRVEAGLEAGAVQPSRDLVATARAWQEASGTRDLGPIVVHAEALLARDPDEALAGLRAALAAYADADRPLERARAELALGRRLRRARRRVDARTHLQAALDAFEELGARAWATQAAAELRASGERARRRTADTRDDLTPQEAQVAELVAQGLSNREVAAQLFVSPRTVEFHLRNVFAKRGLTSRSQLAAGATGPRREPR